MSNERPRKPCSLGLRAQAEKVCVAIVEGTQQQPLLVHRQTLEAPTGSKMPEVLASIRSQLIDIIKKHDVKRIGIRLPEPTARGANKEGARNRTRLDGVLLEIAGTLRLEVVHGALATIAKALGSKDRKKYVQADEFRGLALADVSLEMREAILVGVAALPAGVEQ
jgi:hypothetical protein